MKLKEVIAQYGALRKAVVSLDSVDERATK